MFESPISAVPERELRTIDDGRWLCVSAEASQIWDMQTAFHTQIKTRNEL